MQRVHGSKVSRSRFSIVATRVTAARKHVHGGPDRSERDGWQRNAECRRQKQMEPDGNIIGIFDAVDIIAVGAIVGVRCAISWFKRSPAVPSDHRQEIAGSGHGVLPPGGHLRKDGLRWYSGCPGQRRRVGGNELIVSRDANRPGCGPEPQGLTEEHMGHGVQTPGILHTGSRCVFTLHGPTCNVSSKVQQQR